MFRIKYRNVLVTFVVVFLYMMGIGDYAFTKSFDTEFDYPINADIEPIVKHTLKTKTAPFVQYINSYPYKFIWKPSTCYVQGYINVLILVKSAIENFHRRQAIRQTYGQEDLVFNIRTKTFFLLGVDPQYPKTKVQSLINKEYDMYEDLIQSEFIDNYYNNTIKTMMGFRFAYENCPNADFYFFVDDDMYVSTSNLVEYLYLPPVTRTGLQPQDEISVINPNEPSITGYVFQSKPQRFTFSKWRVSLLEYPWDKWPPYVTAGAYIASKSAMELIYVGCHFVEHFRFDDIYLAIIAKKLNIKLNHCDKIHFYKKPYSREVYNDIIASHGYDDPEELVNVWTTHNRKTNPAKKR